MTSLAKIVFFFSILGVSLGTNANTEGSTSQSPASSTTEQADTSETLSLAKKVELSKARSADLDQYRALLKANMNKQLLQRASKR
ncbi:MAG: hypothetical protein COB51_12690 [Moraxellaceae bacterium]|nr:MAG: hypothetical protein COB51_12690 [Moraxellaceae bacterium]